MKEIDGILNYVGDFVVSFNGKDIQFIGSLVRKDHEVVLECRATESAREFIISQDNYQVCGKVAGTEITLLDCYIASSQLFGVDYAQGKFTIKPSEIIIGCCSKEKILVRRITASIKELNRMFSSRVVKSCIGFTKENPAMLECTFPQAITALDADGKICIDRSIGLTFSHDEHSFHIIPRIEYTFNVPVEIHEAIGKVASVRNLFAFFADYYLPLGELSFTDKEDDKPDNYTLYLNFTEEIKNPDDPFLIRTSEFESSFQNIWDSWRIFYTENKHIAELFYEMITNHSQRTNRFLNLCQCLEVYSRCYRNDDANNIRKSDPEHIKSITLKHRLQDLLMKTRSYLAISEDKCAELAKTISSARNYFTHYDKSKTEPSFDCITYSCEFLHFVLLILVYELLGISNGAIADCRNRVAYKNLDFFISKIK